MPHTVIVGAGTFGASIAWLLARAGQEVTLVDQFEPGDRRASSGGESRLLRSGHGSDHTYTRTARRALELWRELEAESGADLFIPTGVVWFAEREDGWEAESEVVLRELGIPCERLEPAAVEPIFPSVSVSDLVFALNEPEAGVVRAQRAVQTLAAQAREHGARIVRGRARPDHGVVLEDGTRIEGDRVVWACGGWLAGLFPRDVSLKTTCQELLFFDGGPAWKTAPGWVDYDLAMYGTGDLDDLGAKVAFDQEGPPLSPEAELPQASRTEAHVREYLARRFPALADAPLREGRCCRYELSPDSNFIAAPHPSDEATWIVGGGSGHGFKHGPAIAELVVSAIGGGQPPAARFALGERPPGRSFRTAGSGVSG